MCDSIAKCLDDFCLLWKRALLCELFWCSNTEKVQAMQYQQTLNKWSCVLFEWIGEKSVENKVVAAC